MKHNLLKSVILSVVLLMGVSNAWAYVTYYLKSDNTTWNTNNYDWGFTHNTTTTTYMANGSGFKLWRTDYGSDGWFGKGNNTTIDLKENDHNGVQLQQWLDGGNVKYVGPSGMVCFHMDQSNGREDSPWVWITRPTFYLKHNWGGGSWTWKALTDNEDGTYTLTAKYGGTGANYGDNNTSQDGWGYIEDKTPDGSPTTSHNCEFKFNSKDKSLTITRLYTITYNGNGHTGGTVPAAVDKKHGTDFTLSNSTPTRTGYTFAGWKANVALKVNGSNVAAGTLIANGAIIQNISSNITLTAQWTANTYTITWNANGGTVSPTTSSYTYDGTPVELPTPTRANYIFNGWFTAASGGAQVTEVGTTNKPTENVTYFAQWTAKATPTFAWSATSYTAALEADNTFPTLENPNSLSPVTYTSSNTGVATIDANGNITLVAIGTTTITATGAESATHKSATATYELTVNPSNCKWVETTTIDDGDEVVITTKMGDVVYALPNTYGTSTPGVMIVDNIKNNEIPSVSNDIKWTIEQQGEHYIFHPNGDLNSWLYCISNNDGVRVGTNTNKTFVIGQNLESITHVETGRSIRIGTTSLGGLVWRCYTTASDQTLKLYKKVCLDSENYWLTWDAGEGQFEDGKSTKIEHYQVGAEITPPTPTRVGHTFLGYFDAASEGTKYYNADGSSAKNWDKEVAEITLYAQWQQHTVTWNPNGGHWDGDHNKKVETYEYGAEIVRPANPEKTGYAFIGWQPEVAETMPDGDLTYTAQWGDVFCAAYSFHWGNGPDEQVKVDNRQECFVQKDNTHEWQVEGFIIPKETKYFVGYKGWWYYVDLGLGDDNGQRSKSVMKEWTWTGDQVMYLAHVGRGYTLGHAVGAVGTLRIYDNTSLENLDVAFIPDGYGITITSNSSAAKKTAYAFRTTTVDHKWETDIVKMPGITNNEYTVGLDTKVEYVESHHSETKTLEKIGITEVVEGKRMIYLKPNDDWKTNNARFAAYFFGNGEKWVSMTDADGDGTFECEKPAGYTHVIFCRMDPSATANDWANKWNQTGNIELSADGLAKVCTMTGWDTYKVADASPKTGQNGKFRMWDNSGEKNWFVHFVPYYLLNYDPNGGDGTMAPSEYNTEDAYNKVNVAACGFTRTGYDFVAWNTKADGTGTTYNPGDPGDLFTMTADATIYAIWKAQDYQITYRDQGNVDFSGKHGANHPTTHTYDKATSLVSPTRVGYNFDGWYTTSECDGEPITQLGATEYTTDITLYAKWTFAMEYNITNTETIFITSAVGQKIKATTPIVLSVNNMPVGTKVAISAPNITFYDETGVVTDLTTNSISESFSLSVAYTPIEAKITEQPTITLSVLGNEKTFNIISARSLPATFAIVAKVGNLWYALPSQGLNATDDLMGYPVEVDNQDDPTEVRLIPTNADWSLCGVYQSSGSNDRFAANGGNILFVNGDDKALNASRTDGYVLTDAKYDSYQTTTSPDLYEWTPTTTDLETYQLTNANRKDRKLSIDILNRFGVYKGEIENLRFLPIEGERYTQAALQVVEWKENSMVIMYNGNPVQAATIAIDGETNIGSANLGDVNKDFAIYELPAAGLVNNATKRILITIGTEQKWLTIPYIITGEKADTEVVASASAEIAAATDVFILKDAKLSATATSKNTQYRFRNVTVYGGGKLVIGEDKYLSMNSIILRAGGFANDGAYEYVYPQFELKGTLTNTAGKFYYDYITDYDHWYHLVLPFAGDLETIKYPTEFYGSNVTTSNSGSWIIKRYAGDIRATGNYSAWVDIESEGTDNTTPGVGYIFWGAPKKVTVNGDKQRQKWGIQRISMTKGAGKAQEEENGNKKISYLGSYENIANNSGKPNDQGWNLVGNPYMVNLTGLNSQSLQIGQLIHETDASGNWTGKWQWDDTSEQTGLRYVTIPSDHFETYEAKPMTWFTEGNPMIAGRSFFVQIAGAATDLVFDVTKKAALMPALLAENSDKAVDIETGIILSNETLQDEVNFWIKDGKTNDYEYNADYPKTPNNTNFNIYGVHINGSLSWVATGPEYAEESMLIGYQVPAAGTYTLSISETYYSDILDALYVTDHAMSPELTVDLMNAPYEFSVNQAETNNERFTVSVRLKSENQGPTTGLENTGVQRDGTIKFIYQDKMFILHHGKIYDATGKQVTTINK